MRIKITESPIKLKRGGSADWISGAVQKSHIGFCTPMTKKTCTPHRKAFARRAKAHWKQDGGEQDQIMQLIQAYAEKTGTNPEELMGKLQQMQPEEQQQAIQQIQQELQGDQGESENPGEEQTEGGMEEARYGMQIAADGATTSTGLTKADLDAWWADTQKKQQDHSQGQTYSNYAPNYGYNPMSYFPANWSRYTKYKNVNINGVPMGSNQQGNVSAGTNFNLPAQGTPGFEMTSSPRLFGRKYKWSYGPGVNQNSQSPDQRSWVGQKLHDIGPNIDKYGRPFPSKSRREEFDNVQQPTFDSRSGINNQPNSPSYHGMDTGVQPSYVPQVPQVGPAQDNTDAFNKNLQDQYRKAVSERDAVFKEHNINKRGKHRNILGINYKNEGAYQEGGEYDMTDEEIQKLIDGGYQIEYLD